MQWDQFIDWAFLGIVSGGLVTLIKVLSNTNKSIDSLNRKIAVILERLLHHEKRLDHLENKVYHDPDKG